MTGCAFVDCGKLDCPVCSVNERFPKLPTCGKDLGGGYYCQVTGPHASCRKGRRIGEKDDGSDELQTIDQNNHQRPGDPDPSTVKGGDNLAFKKRSRKGPHR